MRKGFTYSILLVALFCSCGLCLAQKTSIKELQAQKQAALARIEETNRLIAQSNQDQKLSTRKLELIASQIATRNSVISNIAQQIAQYRKEITLLEAGIETKAREIDTLKRQYAAFLRQAQFKTNSHSVIFSVLASSNAAQLYRRVRFYREYLAYQRDQHSRIAQEEQELSARKQLLESKRDELLALQREENQNRQNLLSEQQSYDNTLSQLKAQEKELRKALQEEQRRVTKINQAITKLLQEEAEQNKKTARNAAYKTLSKHFAQNKGKLPWPIRQGAITRGYGREQNKIFKGVTTTSQGIDIAARSNSAVLAVFNGTVTKIAHIPGGNNVVIVRHGDYLSLYSNVREVTVRTGEQVKTGQTIGSLLSETVGQKASLHFEIWHGFQSQNPQLWLAP